jgi:acetylornithine deacetylase
MLKPVVAHNGVVRWAIRTEGLAAHSSDPSQGRSAIRMMMKVLDAIESRYIPSLTASHPLTGRAVCSVNRIRGGTQINIIPADCAVDIDRRVVPGEDPQTVLPEVETFLETLRAADPQLVVSQEKPFTDSPLDPAGAEEFIKDVGRVLSACGLDARPLGAPYGTDASALSLVGIPAVVLGPGDIAQAHKAEEWLSLDQLEKGVEVYGALMRGL